MLLNLSNNPEEIKSILKKEVGNSFDLKTNQALNGVDSGLLIINSGSIEIVNLLILNQGINKCNIEIREDGILVRFQINMENYVLVIPFYKLKINKSQADEYTIYRDGYFIKIKADGVNIHDFMRKIRKQKAEHWSSQNFRN